MILLACAERALPYGARSEDCGGCHAEHYAEHAVSGHGVGGSAVFDALLPRVEEAWGSLARQQCEGCHRPGFGEDPAVGCVACHAAVGNHGEYDGRLAVDLDAPLAGPLGAAIATDAHRSTRRALLGDASLCGSCHEVRGPELFVEETLSEHRAAGGDEGCVDCHAPPVADRAWVEGGPVRAATDHHYVGFTPREGGEAATLALLRRALELRVEGDELLLHNRGAGHVVPTGVSFLRELWVEADGEPILRLGATPTRAGEPVVLITDADAVEPGGLAPGESARAEVPEGTQILRLRGRAVRGEILDALALDGEDWPIHEIAAWELQP